jgi:hypothetical protein
MDIQFVIGALVCVHVCAGREGINVNRPPKTYNKGTTLRLFIGFQLLHCLLRMVNRLAITPAAPHAQQLSTTSRYHCRAESKKSEIVTEIGVAVRVLESDRVSDLFGHREFIKPDDPPSPRLWRDKQHGNADGAI